jgi:hypothetical protein
VKKYCAYLLLSTGLLAGVNAIGQPSTPPLPPELGQAQPLVVPFGSAPVVAISARQIAEHLTNFALPEHYVVRTATQTIPAATWNATYGARLRNVPVQIGALAETTLGSIRNPALSNCLAAYFDAEGVESFELSLNGEVETAWIGELQHQRYVELARTHQTNGWAAGDPDPWTIKYVNQRPWFALNIQRLGLLRIWQSQTQ